MFPNTGNSNLYKPWSNKQVLTFPLPPPELMERGKHMNQNLTASASHLNKPPFIVYIWTRPVAFSGTVIFALNVFCFQHSEKIMTIHLSVTEPSVCLSGCDFDPDWRQCAKISALHTKFTSYTKASMCDTYFSGLDHLAGHNTISTPFSADQCYERFWCLKSIKGFAKSI